MSSSEEDTEMKTEVDSSFGDKMEAKSERPASVRGGGGQFTDWRDHLTDYSDLYDPEPTDPYERAKKEFEFTWCSGPAAWGYQGSQIRLTNPRQVEEAMAKPGYHHALNRSRPPVPQFDGSSGQYGPARRERERPSPYARPMPSDAELAARGAQVRKAAEARKKAAAEAAAREQEAASSQADADAGSRAGASTQAGVSTRAGLSTRAEQSRAESTQAASTRGETSLKDSSSVATKRELQSRAGSDAGSEYGGTSRATRDAGQLSAIDEEDSSSSSDSDDDDLQ